MINEKEIGNGIPIYVGDLDKGVTYECRYPYRVPGEDDGPPYRWIAWVRRCDPDKENKDWRFCNFDTMPGIGQFVVTICDGKLDVNFLS